MCIVYGWSWNRIFKWNYEWTALKDIPTWERERWDIIRQYFVTLHDIWKFLWVTELTQWGRLTHICGNKLNIIDSDNSLVALPAPSRYLNQWRDAVNWTIMKKFNEIFIQMYTFSFKKIHLKIASGKWWPFCLGLNVIEQQQYPLLCITRCSSFDAKFYQFLGNNIGSVLCALSRVTTIDRGRGKCVVYSDWLRFCQKL